MGHNPSLGSEAKASRQMQGPGKKWVAITVAGNMPLRVPTKTAPSPLHSQNCYSLRMQKLPNGTPKEIQITSTKDMHLDIEHSVP